MTEDSAPKLCYSCVQKKKKQEKKIKIAEEKAEERRMKKEEDQRIKQLKIKAESCEHLRNFFLLGKQCDVTMKAGCGHHVFKRFPISCDLLQVPPNDSCDDWKERVLKK